MSKHHEKDHAQTKGPPATDQPIPEASAERGAVEEKPVGGAPSGSGPQKGPETGCGAEAEAAATAAASVELGLKSRIAALEAENSSLKDQYLRKAAEFENFRKRMMRDKQDAIDFANQALLLDLIPIIDDFERAIKSSESSGDVASFREGISLIERRLVSQLESKWGLVRFESAGTTFDPNRHEAIMMEKSPDVAEATVAEDLLRGYTLKDRVIRSAKVKVFMPSEESEARVQAETDGKADEEDGATKGEEN